MSRLPQYGKGNYFAEQGYDLPTIVGWLEALTNEEEDKTGQATKRQKRIGLVYDAIDKLYAAIEMGNEKQ